MPIEQVKNGAASTLSGNSGSITAAAVTFNVADGSVFPAFGNFRVLCGSELMIIGARTSNAFSAVVRGAEGTTAAIHADGVAITHIITAAGLKNLSTPTRTVLTAPPVVSTWTTENLGASTFVDDTDSIVLTTDAVANIPAMVGIYRAAPATPYTITAMIITAMFHKPYLAYGISFRQSSDGKMHSLIALAADLGLSVLEIQSVKFPTATSASILYQATKYPGLLQWFRITDDGTNRILSISSDGLNWLVQHTIGRTDYLTANQVGFYVSKQNLATPNFSVISRLVSWAVS